VVREAVALVEPLAASKGLTLRVAEPPAAVELRTDARKVRHALANLLANAIKFTERGMVTVSIHERADEVVLGVADTGIGIPREHLDRIFDPFWQGERLAKRRGGTGLGLSIVRRLTELLGGAVAVDSTLGVGTTFEIVLPRWGAGAGGETRETERQVASSVERLAFSVE
jgi:signal transduction histidine kinase